MTILDELRRLSEAEAPEWAVSGHRVFEDNGPWLGDFLNEGPAELAVAARNALPALLRVAEAARRLAAGPESTAWDELYAALAALEAPREH